MFITIRLIHTTIVILLLMVISNTAGYAQLKANFTANATEGCTPLIVQFTDLSEGDPTEWTWDFGNGTGSVQQNPGVIYVEPGSYTITLTIKNTAGEDSVIKERFITVHPKPEVSFAASPLAGCAPLRVAFTDRSGTSTGTLNNWVWDFGDGTSATGQNPVHTYTLSDTFNVTLIVTNNFGCKQTLLQPSLIAVADTVEAAFSYSYTSGCRVPTTIAFSNASHSAVTLGYRWSFGDGAVSNQLNPVHIYTTPGIYDVILVATNTAGCTDTMVQQISIGQLQAFFTAPQGACINEPVSFKDSSNPLAINGTWNFGDGGTATGLTVTHTYTKAGTYTIQYRAGFGGCTNISTQTIVIADKPTASFSSTSLLTRCEAPLTVAFTNTSTGATRYEWDFGDGATSTETNPVHTYTTRGNFTVKLIAVNASGFCSDTIIKAGFVRINPPNITGIKTIPRNGCAPLTVSFTPEVASSEAISVYAWHFGDGSTSNEPQPSHTYPDPGMYSVTLSVTTLNGCTDSFTLENAVTVTQRPVANFTANPRETCASTEIQFTDATPGNIDSWLWRFGDGSSSTAQHPIHEYEDTGYFSVTLYVTINGCQDSVVFNNYIFIQPPVADFELTGECANPYRKSFRDGSVAPETWRWSFGDGSTSSEQSPIHTYATPGEYLAELIVTNDGCADTVSLPVYVLDEKPGLVVQSTGRNFCKNDPIAYSITGTTPGNIASITWLFGDGDSIVTNGQTTTVYHSYRQSGTYIPMLVTKDLNGCTDTAFTTSSAITIYGPTAAFSNDEGICKGLPFTFNDASSSDGIHPISSWQWSFGDGNTENFSTAPFSHLYSDSGTYDVQLVVFDTNGCTDTLFTNDAVIIAGPVAAFTMQDSIRCTTTNVAVINNSAGLQLSYLWDLGNGNTSTIRNPEITYTKQGSYTISLTVTDRFGCRDSTTLAGAITISNPVARFTVSDSAATCPPLPVQVTNSSSNFSAAAWDFGDGNTSTQIEPFRVYTTPGEYTLQLVVQGFGACFDTATQHISLKGPFGSYSFTPAESCIPAQHSFTVNATNTASFVWDFGNGATVTTNNTVVKYSYPTPGKYVPKLVLQDPFGCSVPIEQFDTITVSGVLPGLITRATTGCDSSLVTFTDSSIVTTFDPIVSWKTNFGDGIISELNNPGHYYKKSGIYKVTYTVQTAKGCSNSFATEVPVLVQAAPRINAVFADSACEKTPVQFRATDAAAITDPVIWQWNFGNDDASYEQNPAYTYKSFGLYDVSVVALASTGCSDTFYKSINILPPPNLDAGENTYVCLDQSITLQPTGATAYNWNNASSLSCTNCENPVATPRNTTTYYVTGDNDFGCEKSDSITITVIQPTTVALGVTGDTICQGSSVLLLASGAEKYTWYPPTGLSNTTIPNPVASPTSTTVYSVIGGDRQNCFADTSEVTVLVAPNPTFQIEEASVTLGAGSNYTIQASSSPDVVRWIWQPPYNLSCTNCPQPSTVAKTNVTYSAQAVTAFGCVAVDNITINVTCTNNNIFIPNTFSPNNDGRNESFYPQGKGLFTIKSMRIFNRWGVMVFSKTNFGANNPGYGWDGNYNGAAQPAGVYVYSMDVLCENGTVLNYKGDITLIR